jgi:hypothetical protein
VWDLSGPRAKASDSWPADYAIETFDDLARATRRLRYLLEDQRILWVNGRHLPQDFELTSRAEGISLTD